MLLREEVQVTTARADLAAWLLQGLRSTARAAQRCEALHEISVGRVEGVEALEALHVPVADLCSQCKRLVPLRVAVLPLRTPIRRVGVGAWTSGMVS